MKFKVERNFLVRTYEEVDLNPENFLHCANIQELCDEVEDYINIICEHPTHPGFEESEQLGVHFQDAHYESNLKSFYIEWQKLKGLPQEL